MKTKLFEKILSLVDEPEKIEFANFHDKAIGDADIVARLEAEINNLESELIQYGIALSNIERRRLSKDIISLLQILNGDKPDDGKEAK